LESVCAGNRTVGSNPTLSAIQAEKLIFFSARRGPANLQYSFGPIFSIGRKCTPPRVHDWYLKGHSILEIGRRRRARFTSS